MSDAQHPPDHQIKESSEEIRLSLNSEPSHEVILNLLQLGDRGLVQLQVGRVRRPSRARRRGGRGTRGRAGGGGGVPTVGGVLLGDVALVKVDGVLDEGEGGVVVRAPLAHDRLLDLLGVDAHAHTDLPGHVDALLLGLERGHELHDLVADARGLEVALLLGVVLEDLQERRAMI